MALEVGAGRILLDDRDARRLAATLGPPVGGTLGVLLLAQERGVLPAVKPVIEALAATDFRLASWPIDDALVTAATKSALPLSRGPSVGVSSTAGRILFSNVVGLPIRTPSQAPAIAPHPVWPRTGIGPLPAALPVNSMLPKMPSLTQFPAIRMLKTSPMPLSKMSSALVRESMRLRITVKGRWPALVSRACATGRVASSEC